MIKITTKKQGLDIVWGEFASQDVGREFVPYHRISSFSIPNDTTIRAIFTGSGEKDFPVSIVELNGVVYATANELLDAYENAII